jgi:hypothetical protein
MELEMTKDIVFNGEFGHELVGVIPYANYLQENNLLGKVYCAKDMRPFYYFSSNVEEKFATRTCTHAHGFDNERSWVPELNTKQFSPPDYKSRFKNDVFMFDKPICVVSNKFNTEWKQPPVNFLSVKTLLSLYDLLHKNYTLIYNRVTFEYVARDDNTQSYGLKDGNLKMIKLTDIYEENKDKYSFNEIQMMIYANTENFISVQGGGSILCSYFGGKNTIYAKKGGEKRNDVYRKWFHKLSGCLVSDFDDYQKLLQHVSENY